MKSFSSRGSTWTVRCFSLIEIMVVLIIIGMIAGMVGLNVRKVFLKAQRRTAKAQIDNFKSCIDDFYLDNNEYPHALEDLVRDTGSKKWNGPYLKDGKLPKDPWGNEYVYTVPGRDGHPYDIVSYGADKAPGGTKDNRDVSCWDEDEN